MIKEEIQATLSEATFNDTATDSETEDKDSPCLYNSRGEYIGPRDGRRPDPLYYMSYEKAKAKGLIKPGFGSSAPRRCR